VHGNADAAQQVCNYSQRLGFIARAAARHLQLVIVTLPPVAMLTPPQRPTLLPKNDTFCRLTSVAYAATSPPKLESWTDDETFHDEFVLPTWLPARARGLGLDITGPGRGRPHLQRSKLAVRRNSPSKTESWIVRLPSTTASNGDAPTATWLKLELRTVKVA
jgi:hypothetical protein